jgi:hypothetical protein
MIAATACCVLTILIGDDKGAGATNAKSEHAAAPNSSEAGAGEFTG